MRAKGIIQSVAGTGKIAWKGICADARTDAIVMDVRPEKQKQCRCGLCAESPNITIKRRRSASGEPWIWV